MIWEQRVAHSDAVFLEAQLFCIIIYLPSQHPGLSTIPSIALQQLRLTEVCKEKRSGRSRDKSDSGMGDMRVVCFLEKGVRERLPRCYSNNALKSGPGSVSGHIQSCQLASRLCPLLLPPPSPTLGLSSLLLTLPLSHLSLPRIFVSHFPRAPSFISDGCII